MNTDYLIIGNSAGGIGAAEAIRSTDTTGSLIIVSEEPYPTYSRPLISEYLSHERDIEDMLYRPADFYKKHSIQLFLGKKALSIDTHQKTVKMDSGENIHWKKLLLATGGIPIIPPVKGHDKKGVFSFLSLNDAREIDAFLARGGVKRAVVSGGGLIGVSVSQALRTRQIHVTIIEMKDRILNTILDEAASAIAADSVKRGGVSIIVNDTVKEISGNASVREVILNSGEQIQCEMVIMAIGVLPQTELAKSAGIAVNRGITVDRYMMTSKPDIYACGDVAEAYDFIIGSNRLTPLWPNAYIGGRIAGFNMAGAKTEYRGGTAMNSINYFNLSIATAGMVSAPAEENSFETLTKVNNATYRKVIIHDNRIAGLILVGDIDKSGILFGLMRKNIDVTTFKSALLADDFGLAYLPASIRKEQLGETVIN